MISSPNNVESARNLHFTADALKEIEWTKRISCSLHEQDWCLQGAQNFVAKFCAIPGRAERVSKTNQGVHFFLQRNMTPDPAAHALAYQDYRSINS